MTDRLPTYSEMLNLNKEDFEMLLLARTEAPYREKLLKEMLEHEKNTGSFFKTAKAEITPEQEMILGVFDEEKSEESINLLTRLSEETNKDTKDEEVDLVSHAIFAKATSDFVGLK